MNSSRCGTDSTYGEQNGARLVRAVLDGAGLHAVISDGKATIEIVNGAVAVSVTNGEE